MNTRRTDLRAGEYVLLIPAYPSQKLFGMIYEINFTMDIYLVDVHFPTPRIGLFGPETFNRLSVRGAQLEKLPAEQQHLSPTLLSELYNY